MPIHVYHCECGLALEMLSRSAATPAPSRACDCGMKMSLQVSAFGMLRSQGWGSDFEIDRGLRTIIDEAQGHKQEAMQIAAEATGNGFE